MALSRGPGRHRRRASPGTGSPGSRSSPRRPSPPTTGPLQEPPRSRPQRALGCNILPARVLRPQDKAACERAFGSLQSLLFEHLPGYTGIDVADRGADPEADADLTMAQMEHLIAEWIVSVWQNRALGEHAPAWGPGGEHSPNTLFAAAMNQGGFSLQVPRPELYYELLPVHHVKVHADRGVKIGGLWYGRADPALKPYEGRPSARGGKHKDAWVIRERPPRPAAGVLPGSRGPGEWHALRWNGLPPEGEIPAFSDKTADDLLRQARAAGLSPKSDDELLPVLLKLLGGVAPVSPVAHPDGQEGEEGPRPPGRPGRPGGQRQERPGARRQTGGGGERRSPPLAGAGVPGPRRDRRRAPAPPRAGGPAAARPARDARRQAALHQPAGASRGGRGVAAGTRGSGQAPGRPARPCRSCRGRCRTARPGRAGPGGG